ncbi:MAG TPA: PadR family transcriptional regulator [Gemmatimonadaceae bacterium]
MARGTELSVADLVVLSMLSERPMHGYELWAELMRRHVWKWAALSRPQVYYSLNKMSRAGYLVAAGDHDVALGPERRVLRPSASGRRALTRSLGRADWSTQRPPPPFVTWMVLAWQASSEDFVEQVHRRHRFLSEQIEEDRAALAAVIAETSASSDAAMVVRLGLRLMETEGEWLAEVSARQRPG